AIAGIPPLAGFWSKDEILAQAFNTNWVYWLIGVITAFITSFYMFRLMYMTFGGDYRGADAHSAHHARAHDSHGHGHGHGEPHESPWIMLGPLVVLAILSLFGAITSNTSLIRSSKRPPNLECRSRFVKPEKSLSNTY